MIVSGKYMTGQCMARSKADISCNVARTVGLGISLFLVLVLAISVEAQDLYICKIQGHVNYEKVELKVGDKFTLKDDTAFEFSSDNDYVILISAEKGRCVISPSQQGLNSGQKKASSERHLWLFVKDNLVPCPRVNSLFSRGSEADIRDYLGNGRWVMLDSLVIPLSDMYLNDVAAFRISFTSGNRSITKDFVPHQSYPFLVIDRETFTVDQNYLDPAQIRDLSLAFYDRQFDMTRKLMDLSIISMNNPEVYAELRAAYVGLVDHTNDDASKLTAEMKAQIEQYYGHIDNFTLGRLLQLLR